VAWSRKFHELDATRWGRFLLWWHYEGVYRLARMMPLPWRWKVIKASRRMLYGPNANNEDLHALLQRATAQVAERA